MNNLELERLLNEKLSTDRINDYAPNGLQVEGKAEIQKIITGVTASQALIDYQFIRLPLAFGCSP